MCLWEAGGGLKVHVVQCVVFCLKGEGQLLESVLKEELRFEADEVSRAHGRAGKAARPDKPNVVQVVGAHNWLGWDRH
jgi:hypothetical protein